VLVRAWSTDVLTRASPRALAVVLGLTLSACDRDRAHGDSATATAHWPVVTAAEGTALIEKYECHRCHEGTGHEPPPVAKNCGGCHREIAAGRFTVPIAGGQPPDPETLAEWREHTRHLVHVPSLEGATARLSREWLARFLIDPSEVRPALEESMPRLRIEPEDARRLATHLARPAPERKRLRGYAARGRRLLEDKGCTACHQFSGTPPLRVAEPPEDLTAAERSAAMALAPDLRHARDRMTPATMIEWVVDPDALQSGTLMRVPEISRAEAEHIVAYIVTAPLAAPSSPAPVARLALLERPVSFTEVAQKVLRGSCWHCHSDPDYAFGDGGPGNTGGFGFAGKGIQLATYEGVLSGYVDADGERQSLIEARDGSSLLVDSLLARREEEAGRPRSDVLGMPLGLPSLSAEQLQLVETWVAQGAPR
jgi:hypothetical protein